MSSAENSPVAVVAGRKLILSGAILIGLSVLLGMVGTRLTLGQFSTGQLTRDVVINGATNPKVPGKLSFEVPESLNQSSAQDELMHVGVAVEYSQLPAPVCTMSDSSGTKVPLSVSASGEALLGDSSGNFSVLGSAVLAPGEYQALCTRDGEPSSSSASFTVGKVFGMDDLTGTFAPFLWFLAVGLFCGLMFLVGVILMIVGLVKRSKAKKSGLGLTPGAGTLAAPAAGAYSQVPPPASLPASQPPAWPGPHPPGPPEAAQPQPTAQPPAGPPADSPTDPPADPPTGWTVPPSKLR